MIGCRLLVVLGLSLALSACESKGTYEEPLIRGGVLEGETSEEAVTESLDSERPRTVRVFRREDDSEAVYDASWNFDRLDDLTAGSRPPLDSDEAGWWMMMDRWEDRLKTSGQLVRDEELDDYVDQIVCQIAGEFCGDVRVYIVQNPHFNALMAPNGTMVIYTGLLLRMRNEAQLAAVLGHEIGHYVRRHTLQRMRDVEANLNFLAVFQLALMAAAQAGYGGYANLAGDIANIAVLQSILAFSREHEREADGYGMLLVTKAGYDPREVSKVWAQILREREADAEDSQPVFYSTHPPSEERQAALENLGDRVFQEMNTESVVGRDSFIEMMMPRRAAYLEDELNLRDFDRSEMLIEMLIEDEVNLAELYYFKGELYRLRGKDEDEETALENYEIALEQTGSAPPEIYRSLGVLSNRRREPQKAIEAFRRYLELQPRAKDRLVIEHLIKELSTS